MDVVILVIMVIALVAGADPDRDPAEVQHRVTVEAVSPDGVVPASVPASPVPVACELMQSGGIQRDLSVPVHEEADGNGR